MYAGFSRILSTYSVGTTELYYNMKKRQHSFDILKVFFVRHSSEYETSDSDRKVNRNIKPDAVTCDRMSLIGPRILSRLFALLCCLLFVCDISLEIENGRMATYTNNKSNVSL